jgi:hypothetical protein
MCPINQIWSVEQEACVDLDPTAEPAVTTAPTATTEPTPTVEPESPEPTIPVEVPPTSGVDEQTAPTTEAAVASPGADPSGQFGFDAPSGLQLWELTCDQVIAPTDSLEEILPRCRFHYNQSPGAPGITYDVFVNGRLVWTSYDGGDFWRNDLPGGDYRIVARYHLGKQDRAPIAHCGVHDNEQEEPLFQVGPGQVHSNGDYLIADVPAGADQITCAFYYFPVFETAVSVDLIAHFCPQAVVDQHIVNYRDLVVRCGVSGPEVEMQMTTSNGVANQFTHLGLASFNDLPAGAILVREVIPDGYGVPLVYCMVTGPEGQTIKQQDLEIIGQGYYVTVADVPPGSSVLCEFFNVPGETPEYGGPPVT